MPDALPGPFLIRVPSDLSVVRPVRKMIHAMLEAQGWGEEDTQDVGLLVTEMLQNAVEHGSKGAGDESIHVRCEVSARDILLDVSDPGTGKDPGVAVACDVSVMPPLDGARGRGLFLINRLATSCERQIGTEGGLRIVVRREISTS